MKFFVTGDKHGRFKTFVESNNEVVSNCDNAIIVLGDSGLNYYLNEKDDILKSQLNKVGCKWYLLNGNHEMRASRVPGMSYIYDSDVEGGIWYQTDYSNIRYFNDFGIYKLNEYKIVIIGGAYSVDKYYRLERGWNWFPDEELSDEEMDKCIRLMEGQSFDFVLSHTCPLAYEPKDLFLSFIDQPTVSKRMEEFLDRLKDEINWNYWLFGHFHADRIEAPHVEQYYNDIDNIEDIITRWKKYDETGELDWWLNKGPDF